MTEKIYLFMLRTISIEHFTLLTIQTHCTYSSLNNTFKCMGETMNKYTVTSPNIVGVPLFFFRTNNKFCLEMYYEKQRAETKLMFVCKKEHSSKK